MNVEMKQPELIRIGDRLIDLGRPVVMGILNVTPDSFHPPSRVRDTEDLLLRAEKMVGEGATILDVGGYSSRPGADVVSEKEEQDRVVSAIGRIVEAFPWVALSVDTFRRGVAEKSVEAGARVVNDISAGGLDATMIDFVADSQVAYVVGHMRGTPKNMMKFTSYDNLVVELNHHFSQVCSRLSDKGITQGIIDPCFGFSKSMQGNYTLLRNLDALAIHGHPLMVGLSRKSMISTPLEKGSEGALSGTSALHMAALERGARILRVHDVGVAMEVVELFCRLHPSSS